MANPARRFSKSVPLRKISELYNTSLSRQIDIDIDEDDEYIDQEEEDGLSVFSDEEFTFNIDTSVPENVSLPSSDLHSTRSEIELLIKNLPGFLDYRLTPLETVCIATVLEEANDKLDCIKSILPAYKNMDTVEHMNINEKYDCPAAKRLIFPEEGGQQYETQQLKFQRLRHYLSEILLKTNTEIKRESTYNTLRDWIADDRRMKEQVVELLSDRQQNSEVVAEIKKEMAELEVTVRETTEYASGVVGRKDATIHDIMAKAELENKFVQGYEEARVQQCSYMWREVDKLLQRDLIAARMGVTAEYRVNSEIETYVSMKNSEYTEEMEMLQELYENNLEDMEQALVHLKRDREEQMDNYLEMKATFRKRKTEIDEYLIVREERRVRLEHEALRSRMALRIQAWWRGTMVRKGLGRFGTKKKKKGKGKGKKKSKGRRKNK